jgi:hypothetical protein
MVTVPVAIAFSTPVDDPIDATDVLPLLHVPPEVASVNVRLPPVHSVEAPDIDTGIAFTVTVFVTLQPADIP